MMVMERTYIAPIPRPMAITKRLLESAKAPITPSKEKLASYKYPRRVFFTDAFPLGPSGKVLKRELVEQYKG